MRGEMGRELIFEVDTDGVLANNHGALEEKLQDVCPGFSEETHILSWEMKDLKESNPKCYDKIFELFKSPSFIADLPRFVGIEVALKKLCDWAKTINGRVVLHTHMYSEETAEVRREWLHKLKEDSGADFDIDVCVGDEKSIYTNSTVIVEDNVQNLCNSNAPIKFMVRKSHNREFTLNDIGEFETGYVVNSFVDAVDMIIRCVEKGR